LGLVEQLRELVAWVHKRGVVIVDLNPMNILVSSDFTQLAMIDVDSWQTAGYPATALQESIRDRHSPTGVFSEGSDWFAFAIVSFQMLIGIHPYKGRHPSVKGLDARMIAGMSVLNPQVKIPPVCYRLLAIPDPLRHWYEGVFHRHERTSPPRVYDHGFHDTLHQVSTCESVEITELCSFSKPVRHYGEHNGREVVIVGDQVVLGGHVVATLPPGPVALGFCGDRPIVGWLDSGRLELFDVYRKRMIPVTMSCDEIAEHMGRIYIKSGGLILELLAHPDGDNLMVSTIERARVVPRASRLFGALAVQNLLGSCWISVFKGEAHFQTRVQELDGAQVVDGRLCGTTAMLLVARSDRFDHVTINFANGFSSYKIQVTHDVVPQSPNVVSLPNGLKVSLFDEGQLTLSYRGRHRKVLAPTMTSECRLIAMGGGVGFIHGGTVYRAAMK